MPAVRRHAVAGVIARVIVVEAEVHRVQLGVLPQPFQHRLDGEPAAGNIAVLLPAVGIEGSPFLPGLHGR